MQYRDTCPGEQQLRDFTLGKLSAEDADGLFQHINGCPECTTRLDGADQADDFVLNVLKEQQEPPTSIDESLQEALERISSFETVLSLSTVTGTDDAADAGLSGNATLRDYEVLHTLGQGGMGTVYKARHLKLDRVCAVKVLRAARASGSQFNRRFEREIRAIGRLDHPNIVRATDAGSHDGRLFLVMEYIDGVDVSTLANHIGQLSVADACEVVRQTAIGLDYAHSNGMVHRDVKPANIMVDTLGQVRLLDLGLARWEQHDESLQELTGTDQIMGTVDYIAPEQAATSHAVDASSDIYSLGCTLYRLLAGRPPFAAPEFGSTVQKLLAHASRSAEPLSELRSDIPRDLSDLVDRMLAKEPSARPASASVVAELLAGYSKQSCLPTIVAQCPTPTSSSVDEQCKLNLMDSIGLAELRENRSGPARSMLYASVPLAVLIIAASMFAWHGAGGHTNERERQATLAILGNDHSGVDGEPYYSLPENPGEQPEYAPTSFPRLVPEEHTSDRDGNYLSPHVMTRLGSVGLREPASALSLSFLNDGAQIMSATPRAVRVWDTATGRELKTYAIRHGIRAAAVADDQSVWAALSGMLGIVVWHEDGRILHYLDRAGNSYESIALSFDGTTLAAAGRDGSITLWSIESGQVLQKLSAHDASISQVVFSADAQLLASVSNDGFLRVWQLPSGKLEGEFSYTVGKITAVSIATSGRYLACALTDGSVHVSSLETGEESNTWIAHQNAVLDIAFSPDGDRLATGGKDHMVRVWDWRTAEAQWIGVGHVGAVGRVSFHPQGELVISTGTSEHPRHYKQTDGAIRIWDATTGEQIQPGSRQESHMLSIAMTSGGERVVGARGNRTVSVWDRESGDWIGELSNLSPGAKPLAVSPSDDRFAVVSGGSLLLHDLTTLTNFTKVIPESYGRIESISFNPTNTQLALAHASGKIHVYDTETRQRIQSWQAHDAGCRMIHSPDGRLLASSSGDKTLAVWDAVTFELLYRKPGHVDGVQSITFSPDGWLLASAGYNGRIMVREVITGDVVRDIKSETGLNCIRFAPDNRTLIAGEFYDRLLCWDVSSGSRYVEIIARSGCTITDLALTRDGTLLASAGDDGSVLLWDLPKLLRKAPALNESTLSESRLQRLWNDLARDDAELAFAAVWDLVAGRKQAVPFIESRLTPKLSIYPQPLRFPADDAEDRHQRRAAQVLKYAKGLD